MVRDKKTEKPDDSTLDPPTVNKTTEPDEEQKPEPVRYKDSAGYFHEKRRMLRVAADHMRRFPRGRDKMIMQVIVDYFKENAPE